MSQNTIKRRENLRPISAHHLLDLCGKGGIRLIAGKLRSLKTFHSACQR
jgi:hypothetical protein